MAHYQIIVFKNIFSKDAIFRLKSLFFIQGHLGHLFVVQPSFNGRQDRTLLDLQLHVWRDRQERPRDLTDAGLKCLTPRAGPIKIL